MCVHIKVHMHRCHTYAVYALQRSIGVRMHIHLNVHRCHIFDSRAYGMLVCACTSMCICTGVTYWPMAAEHEGVHAHQCACAPVSHICKHDVVAEHERVHAHRCACAPVSHICNITW